MRSALAAGIVLIFVLGAFAPVTNSVDKNTMSASSSSVVSKDMVESLKDSDDLSALHQKNIQSIKDRNSPPAPLPLNVNDAWWNYSWLYRKEITIDRTKIVSGPLYNFPMLISLPSDADLASKAQSDGDDLVFTDKTGIKLNHEIELFQSTTGKLVAWMNVSSLSSTVNTVLYVYYGNPSCSNQENPEGVWDSHYVMVQHLSETTGTHYDSTTFDNDGTPIVTMQGSAAGKIDGADVFDGSDDDISIPDSTSLSVYTNGLTASAWIKLDEVAGSRRQGIFCKYNTAPQTSWLLEYQDGPNGHDLLFLNSADGTNYKYEYAELNPVIRTWYLVTVVWSPNVVPKIYKNGVLLADDGNSGTISSIYDSNTPLLIGEIQYNAARNFDGVIDEARVSNIARSAEWIATEYNNENNPGIFYSIGNEESPLGNNPPLLSDPNPANGAVGVSINISSLSIMIQDSDGDLFNWMITTSPNVGSNTGIGASNGTKTCLISGLTFFTTYTWYMKATDGTSWTNVSYTFTTEAAPVNNPPFLSNPNPADESLGISISFSSLSIMIQDPEGDHFNWMITTSPNVGSNTGTGASNGTKTCSISGLTSSMTYTWYVSVTDGFHWTNKTYIFTTAFNPDAWKYWKKITVNKQQIEDNCRIYAILSDNLPNGLLQNDLIDAPNSLEYLSASINIDGWGIGYYPQYSGSATINRGAQQASNDPGYDTVVQQINASEPKITLAHIRNCQNGCCCHGCETIDDPHPFMRVKNGKTWTFIHNGVVHESLALPLLGDYLTDNPLNCSGVCPDNQHCDSEIYFLLLLKYIENNSWHVTNGIVEGINALVNAGETGGLNFILSDGEKMWAFRRHQLSSHTLYYLNDTSGGYAAVASQYPSSTQEDWVEMDDYQLVQLSSHTEPLVINVLNYTLIPNLRDFPVLIDIVDSDLASKAQSDGDDILFTDVHKNKLDHEIEFYNSTTGHLAAWVRLPHLFMNEEEDVYMFYGNQNAENQQNVSGVWNTHYMVVHHLEETSGALLDSTKNSNDGIPQNGVVLNVPGRRGSAAAFDGTNDYVSIADDPTLDGDGNWSEMTMETWVKTDVNQTQRIILAKWGSASSRSYEIGINTNGNTQLFAGIDNGAYLETLASDVSSLTPGVWYHVAATYKDGVLNLYINGVLDANHSNTGGNIHASSDSLKIGARNPTPERFFDGSIDEVRISNVARDSNWTLLSYRNQNDTSMFISVGPEEGQGIHITNLTEQWNFVSTAYNQSINKTGLTIVSGGIEYTWANATTAGIILGFCYEWNRGTQSYQLSDPLKPGQGYWVYAYSACEVWLKNAEIVDLDTYITALSTQWNVVGIPYEESVGQGDLMIQYIGTDYSWSQATTSNNPTGYPLVLGFVYGWNTGSQSYLLSDVFEPGFGYWMYAYHECSLQQ